MHQHQAALSSSSADTVSQNTTVQTPVDTMAKASIGDSIFYAMPNISTLNGRLIQKLFYGPPGFGSDPKKDVHYTFFVLVLAKPITVIISPANQMGEGKTDESIQEIDSIQIKDQRTNPELIANVGKNVTVTGLLNQAILPSEYTPVVLDFKAIKSHS